MPITAILLAAGFSRRAGENKLLFPVNNSSLFETALTKICKFDFDEKIVVTNNEELIEIAKNFPVSVVLSPKTVLGKSESIKEAVKTANPKNDLMFFVCDQPFLNEETILKILKYYDENFQAETIIFPKPIFKTNNLNTKGNPCIFAKTYRDKLLSLTGDHGGREIIKNNPNAIFVEIENEKELLDIDTVYEYSSLFYKKIVIVRGAGDLASGVIQSLHLAGFSVLALEIETPTAIRRTVSFSSCIECGTFEIEKIKAKHVKNYTEIFKCFESGEIPVLIDEDGSSIEKLNAIAVVDAILAKKNLGTNKKMAPITIALGPGFEAGKDVDIVIETMRGHNLGRLIFNGKSLPNTGIPGEVAGIGADRVVHAENSGKFISRKKIGDIVHANEIIGEIDEVPVITKIDGLLRGLIVENYLVTKNLKIADIDPRINEINNFETISDKARALGGAVLTSLMYLSKQL